jgi:hypothetical protein
MMVVSSLPAASQRPPKETPNNGGVGDGLPTEA